MIELFMGASNIVVFLLLLTSIIRVEELEKITGDQADDLIDYRELLDELVCEHLEHDGRMKHPGVMGSQQLCDEESHCIKCKVIRKLGYAK